MSIPSVRGILLSIFLTLSPTLLLPSFVRAAAEPKGGGMHLQLMFVQTADSVAFDGNKMTLKGVNPATIYFSDRPERITGHMTLPAFLKEWDAGKDSFSKDPPNATLSILNPNGAQEVVVEITNPTLSGQDLSYDVKVLQGTPPAKGGISSLFIDWYSYYYNDYCHRNGYTGAMYCYRPGYYYHPPGWYY